LVSKALGWSSFYPINTAAEFMSPSLIWILLIFALLIGFAGKSYTSLYAFIARIFKRAQGGNILVKVIIGSAISAVGIWFLNPHLMGTSQGFIGALFIPDLQILFGNLSGLIPLVIVLIIMAIGKAVANCITIGSGMSAGFTGPAALIGMLLGAAWAEIFHLVPGSPDYSSIIAAGFAGMLGSTMNIPIAAAILTTESFGLQYSFPAALASIIAFQINRHKTIYSYTDYRK
jgi:chloride channel protein, CIC family